MRAPLSPLKTNVRLRPWACTHTVPVFRLWFNNSACRGCECAVAKERGVGWLSSPVEQFTSAPQKIRLSVSSTSLHCTFIQRAWRKGESNRQGDTWVNAHVQKKQKKKQAETTVYRFLAMTSSFSVQVLNWNSFYLQIETYHLLELHCSESRRPKRLDQH